MSTAATIPARSGVHAPVALRHRREQLFFPHRERLQNARKRHLLIELRVTNRNGRLVRENSERFFVIGGQEVRIAAQERHSAEGSLFVAQRERVETAVFVCFEHRNNLRARFLRFEVPAIGVKVGSDCTLLVGYPFESFARSSISRVLGTSVSPETAPRVNLPRSKKPMTHLLNGTRKRLLQPPS